MIIEAIHNIVWEFAKVMNISVEIYDQDIENSFLKPCVCVNSNIHLFLLWIDTCTVKIQAKNVSYNWLFPIYLRP